MESRYTPLPLIMQRHGLPRDPQQVSINNDTIGGFFLALKVITVTFHPPHPTPWEIHRVDMVCKQEELELVTQVWDLYEQISSLETLKPSKDVNMLFTKLVLVCMPLPPNPIDVTKLPKKVQEMRSNLIQLCGKAEGLLESHFSTILASYQYPLHHLNLFPYFSNYLKLSQLEFNILTRNTSTNLPKQVAFVGSGPLPLTSIVLATFHLPNTTFHNFDIDPAANFNAQALVSSDPYMSKRMLFHTCDIMNVTNELREFDVVFLAALVGMNKEDKVKVIEHLAKYMASGAVLMLRSAHGARAFLYPIVDPCHDLVGFEVLEVYHPSDEVINSVVIARKVQQMPPVQHPILVAENKGQAGNNIKLPCKCYQLQALNTMVEEFAVEKKL